MKKEGTRRRRELESGYSGNTGKMERNKMGIGKKTYFRLEGRKLPSLLPSPRLEKVATERRNAAW